MSDSFHSRLVEARIFSPRADRICKKVLPPPPLGWGYDQLHTVGVSDVIVVKLLHTAKQSPGALNDHYRSSCRFDLLSISRMVDLASKGPFTFIVWGSTWFWRSSHAFATQRPCLRQMSSFPDCLGTDNPKLAASSTFAGSERDCGRNDVDRSDRVHLPLWTGCTTWMPDRMQQSRELA